MAEIATLLALASQIQQAHERCQGAFLSGLNRAVEAGLLLIMAKERVGHGGWLPWLTKYCPDIPERLAQKYMHVARELPKLQAADSANTPRVADLSFRQALELCAQNAKAARRIPPNVGLDVIEERTQSKRSMLSDSVDEYKLTLDKEKRQKQEKLIRDEHRTRHADELPRPVAPKPRRQRRQRAVAHRATCRADLRDYYCRAVLSAARSRAVGTTQGRRPHEQHVGG